MTPSTLLRASPRVLVLGAALLATAQAHAQNNTLPGDKPSIYTCVDAQGRRLTSDRPIPECMAREQRELTPSGSLKRTVPPVLTAEEKAREAARQREVAARQAQLDEEKRKSRALITRFPDQVAHDKSRAEALAQIDELIGAVRKRQAELDKQRNELNTELEFYRSNPTKAPAWLRRLQDENARQRASQDRYLADQISERARTDRRFEEELQRLRELWKAEGR
jgi:Domain of unknown function (DUF4124)